MSQPYNLAYLLHPMFNHLLNCAGTMGLFSGERQTKAVAYMVRTHISEKFQEIFTQHEAHNTEPSQTFFSKTGTDLIPRTDLRQRDKAGDFVMS